LTFSSFFPLFPLVPPSLLRFSPLLPVAGQSNEYDDAADARHAHLLPPLFSFPLLLPLISLLLHFFLLSLRGRIRREPPSCYFLPPFSPPLPSFPSFSSFFLLRGRQSLSKAGGRFRRPPFPFFLSPPPALPFRSFPLWRDEVESRKGQTSDTLRLFPFFPFPNFPTPLPLLLGSRRKE